MKIEALTISKGGPIDLKITIFRIGKGSPKMAIINGLHGEERTGALLIKEIAERFDLDKGELILIPFANPTSALANTRKTPEDLEDLNRIFPGNKVGTLSFRLAYTLATFLKDFDLIIDIHTFPKMAMPLVGVFFNRGTRKQKRRVLELLRVFSPDYIWKLDTKVSEKGKAGSLVETLIEEGRLAFAIEVPDIELISREQEKRGSTSLLKVLRYFAEGGPSELDKEVDIPIIERVPAASPTGGIFVPKVDLDGKVRRGEMLGEIISLDNLAVTSVAASIAGPVVFILKKTVVLPGERVAIIGKKAKIEI